MYMTSAYIWYYNGCTWYFFFQHFSSLIVSTLTLGTGLITNRFFLMLCSFALLPYCHTYNHTQLLHLTLNKVLLSLILATLWLVLGLFVPQPNASIYPVQASSISWCRSNFKYPFTFLGVGQPMDLVQKTRDRLGLFLKSQVTRNHRN